MVDEINKVLSYAPENLTKDEAGNTTNFRLILNVDFIVKSNGFDKTISYIEKFDIKESGTLFEQSNYEKTIKKDMIDLIEERLCRDKNHNLACLQISVSNEGDLDPVPTRRRVPARP